MALRVLLLVSTLEGDGGERSVGPGKVMSTLARQLTALGCETLLVSCFGPTVSDLLNELEDQGVTVDHLEMASMWDPQGAKRLVEIGRRWRPDVVHTRTIRADLMGRLMRRTGSVVVNNVVNLYPDDTLNWHGPVKGRIVLSLARRTSGWAEIFVANAEGIVPSIEKTFDVERERIRVVHDGIDLDLWTQHTPTDLSHLDITPQHRVVLTTARLHQQKGLTHLIEAASRVRHELPDVRFVVAGEGPLKGDLERQIAESDLGGTFFLLGWRTDIGQLLARADLYVLPSLYEGLPNAVIEAMASGTPVIATDVAGTPEIVAPGLDGWLVRPGRPDELATALTEAFRSDLGSMGRTASRRAGELFSSERMAAEFARCYEELLRRNRHVAA